MRTENSSSLLPRSPLRLDRMPDQTRRSSWEGPGTGRSSSHGAAPLLLVEMAFDACAQRALPPAVVAGKHGVVELAEQALGAGPAGGRALLQHPLDEVLQALALLDRMHTPPVREHAHPATM